MNATTEMLRSGPNGPMADERVLAACITECFDCAAICSSCADACLGEPEVAQLRKCVRLDLDCADVCAATARLLSRQQDADLDLIRGAVELASLVSHACAMECARHSKMHGHCRICAEACLRCERTCQSLLSSLRDN